MMPFKVMRKSSGGGGGGATIPLSAPSSAVADPADASATLQFTNAGVCNSTGQVSQNWLISGAAADYQIKVDPISGGFSSGDTTGAWLSLSITRSWTRNRTTIGSNTTVATVTIRQAVGGAIVAGPADVTWYAEVS